MSEQATKTKQRVPALRITCTGGRNLGRCYNATFFEVVSTRPLLGEDAREGQEKVNKLVELRRLGFLGYGQEFSAGGAEVKPEDEFYDPEEFQTSKHGKVYVYRCESRVDSSD